MGHQTNLGIVWRENDYMFFEMYFLQVVYFVPRPQKTTTTKQGNRIIFPVWNEAFSAGYMFVFPECQVLSETTKGVAVV